MVVKARLSFEFHDKFYLGGFAINLELVKLVRDILMLRRVLRRRDRINFLWSVILLFIGNKLCWRGRLVQIIRNFARWNIDFKIIIWFPKAKIKIAWCFKVYKYVIQFLSPLLITFITMFHVIYMQILLSLKAIHVFTESLFLLDLIIQKQYRSDLNYVVRFQIQLSGGTPFRY